MSRLGFLLCFSLFWTVSTLDGQTASVDELQNQGVYYLNRQPDSALWCFEQALILCEVDQNLSCLGLTLNRVGVVHKNKGAYPEALSSFRKSLKIRLEIRDSAGIASVYNNIGNVYKSIGNYDSALFYAFECLDVRERLRNEVKLASSYLNLGNIYGLQKDWSQATDYYQKSLESALGTGNQSAEALARYSLGNVLVQNQELAAARNEFEQSLELERAHGNSRNIARNLSALGVIYELQQDYRAAEKVYREVLQIHLEMNGLQDVALTYLNLGTVANALGQPDSAQTHFHRCIGLSLKIGQPETAIEGLGLLHQLQVDQKNWQQALLAHQQYTHLKDSLYNETTARNFAEIQEKYAATKRQQQIDWQQTTLDQKKWEFNLILICSAALILIGGIGFLGFRNKTRDRALIARQNAAIQLAGITDQLKEKELESLEALLKGQAEERKRIARDLHDQLGGTLAAVKLHFNSLQTAMEPLGENTNSRYEKANQALDFACSEVRTIAHNMAPGRLVESGLESMLNELTSAVEQSSSVSAQVICNGLDDRLDETTELQVYRLIQELVSNVIRHASAQELTIQLTRTEDNLNIVVEDDGKGFNPSVERKGLGLPNITSRVAELGGIFSLDSQPHHGTTAIIDLPVATIE